MWCSILMLHECNRYFCKFLWLVLFFFMIDHCSIISIVSFSFMKLESLLNPFLSSLWGLLTGQFSPIDLLSEAFCLQLHEFGKTLLHNGFYIFALVFFDIVSSLYVVRMLYFYTSKCFAILNKLICSWWELSEKQEGWGKVEIISKAYCSVSLKLHGLIFSK